MATQDVVQMHIAKDGVADDVEAIDISPPDETKNETGPRAMTVTMTALCLSILLAALDQTIISTALPVISEHFGSSTGYVWVGSSYVLASATTVPAWGKISDNFGRKPMLLLAVFIFLAGSLICALSISTTMLIAGRVVQGCGGGGINVLSNITISDLVPIGKRSMYFGLVGIVWAFASAVGPVIGGILTQKISWRWCFWINLPIGGLSMSILYFFLKLKTPTTSLMSGLKAIDWSGIALIIGGTVMFLIGLDIGGVISPWGSAKTICLLIFGVLIWGLFLLNEHYIAKEPLMPLVLFTNRQSNLAFGIGFIHGLVFIAGPYYLPLYFQSVLLASPIQSGAYLSPYYGFLAITSFLTSIWIRRTGKYILAIQFGLFFATLGHGLMIDLPIDRYWPKIILYTGIAGFGVGPNFQSPLLALQSSTDEKHIASSTATFAFCRNLATSMSIAVGGVIFQNVMSTQYQSIEQALGPELAAKFSGAGAESHVGLIATLPQDAIPIVQNSFLQALQKIWIFYTVVSFVAIILSCFMKENYLKKHF